MDWFSASDYWLSRLVIQRGLGAIYLIAFVNAINQFRPLLGADGLQPVPRFLERVGFRQSPSLFHFRYSDQLATIVAVVGAGVAAAVVIGLPERAPLWVPIVVWLVLWGLYLSIVNVGQTFYGFGWESLLLEAGFIAAFLGNARTAPPVLVIWVLRWLVFRLEFGAGLIKLRGDRCWRDLTCLYFHHETQPMPNPLSWYFHHLPKRLHKVEVAANHFAQLVVPFGLFTPQPGATIAGAVIVVSQSWLVASGNFSWLNVVTIVLALSAFDDSFLDVFVPVSPPELAEVPGGQVVLVLALTALVAVLSYWPVANLLSRQQHMNVSFNRWHLVNSYGAFGSITKVRHEIVIEGTEDDVISPATVWKEYEFKGKPGVPRRRPRQFAPYHLRLDWLMWFAALRPGTPPGWFRQLMVKLLADDRGVVKLLRDNPFPDRPPRLVRARYYRYRYTTWRERRDAGDWWHRTLVGDYLAPVGLRRTDPPR